MQRKRGKDNGGVTAREIWKRKKKREREQEKIKIVRNVQTSFFFLVSALERERVWQRHDESGIGGGVGRSGRGSRSGGSGGSRERRE